MAKLLKIIGRTIGITFEWLLVFVILLAFLIRLSAVQTYLGSLATDYLSSELNTEIRIGKIDITFINRVQLKDVYVEDLNKDTLASIGVIDVRLKSLGDPIVIKEASLENGRIGINKDKETGDFNFDFIADYFDDGKPKDPNSKPTAVEVETISLKAVNLSYDDNRKPKSTYGIDYDHLYFRNLNLSATNFSSTEDEVLGLTLTNLSAKEQCGLDLRNLSLNAVIHPKKGILLSKIVIQTPKTSIYANRFNLRLKSFDDFDEFNSKVTFDGQIDSSTIDLKDVTYFVSDLEGMDQTVYLSATLSEPIDNLQLTDLDLRFGKRSVIRGDYSLPNFALKGKAKVDEEIDYAFLDMQDIEAFHLPKSAGMKSINVGPQARSLGYAELRKFHVNGEMQSFVLKADKIGTNLGSVRLNNGIRFNQLEEGGYAFTKTTNSNYDVKIDSFQLGKFIDVADFGTVSGSAFLTGIVGQKDMIRLTEVSGDFDRFGYNNYNYTNIAVRDGSFINNVFESTIDITDPHLNMHYDGLVDVNKQQRFDLELKITKADLQALHFMDDPNAKVIADLDVNMHGSNIDNYQGTVQVDQLEFYQQDKKIEIPDLDLMLTRGAKSDSLIVESEVADIHLGGKITSGNLVTSLNNSFSELLPTIIKPMKEKRKNAPREFFNADITLKQTAQVLDLYYPELHITPGSVINLSYDSEKDLQTMTFDADEIALIPVSKDSSKVQKQYLSNVRLTETLVSGNMETKITATKAAYNDSLYVSNFNAVVNGHQGSFDTRIEWNQGMRDSASIAADLVLKENNAITATVQKSYFSLEGNVWQIKKAADIVVEENHIVIDDLGLERGNQLIRLDGVLSNDENEKIELTLRDVHVEEFAKILDPTLDIVGRLDGTAYLKTPFTLPQAEGNMALSNLFLSKQEIGTVTLSQFIWNPNKEKLTIFGDLNYLGNETFKVEGDIFPLKEDNNYNLTLLFKKMDIRFASAFVDPELVSNLEGNLNGRLRVTGKLETPNINGNITLRDAKAKIGMLGTTYSIKSGEIVFDGKNGKIGGALPVTDEEGNPAVADVRVNHTDFSGFKVKLNFEFNKEAVNTLGYKPFTGKFMVLNTQYKEGEIYYGKAYASGRATIEITDFVTKIDVHATTEPGTSINLPMYGASEVSDFDFIEYYNPDGPVAPPKKLSGVDMDLELDITDDAVVNLIFNEKTGDAIRNVTGKARTLDIRMHGDVLTMNGMYTVTGGEYNLVMYGIKEKFALVPGGTITWNGDPVNANLNLKVSKTVQANFSDLAQDGQGNTKNVKMLILVNDNLNKPRITLGISDEGLTASEKSMLARATQTEQEMQAQWFSLIKSHRFLNISGTNSSGGGTAAAEDLLGTYANDFIGNLTNNRVQYSGSETSTGGQKSLSTVQDFGKVTITTSAGVQTSTMGEESSSSLVGEVAVDIKLNDDGSLKAKIFNESNDPSSSSSENGAYTQGVGLYYSEEFNKTKDSRVLKLFSDPFNRKGSRKRKKDNKVPTKEPPKEAEVNSTTGTIIVKEE
jgi:hypothetical protein